MIKSLMADREIIPLASAEDDAATQRLSRQDSRPKMQAEASPMRMYDVGCCRGQRMWFQGLLKALRFGLASLLLIGAILNLSVESAYSEPHPPPIASPPNEDFGFHPLSATPEEVKEGQNSKIESEDQRHIWQALLRILLTNNGYHTPDEIERAFGLTLTLTHKPNDAYDTGQWDAELPSAHLRLFENGPHSRIFGQSSLLSVGWIQSLTRPQCIAALKVFADVQRAGAIGFQEVVAERRFRLGHGGEEIAFDSRGLTEQTCVSHFLLTGRMAPKEPPK